ncbi:MAG TPA: NUDIX hydrolase [Gaiellaceae bacterium]|jgi:8-oxo-dGTP pyrophosphatase MutT (NUDIX family)|nr:NUDIX hydrolase [Gaiellaceae bacterium]
MGRWKIHGEHSLHESDTVRLSIADLELADGTRCDHYVIRIPFEVVSVVVTDGEGRVLLLWRHRFIPDRWGWDVPAGKVAPGEAPADAAVRASVDETGWFPGPARLLGEYHPTPGISDQRFGVYVADGAERVAKPNLNETERVEWVPIERVRKLIGDGQVDGLSLTSLLWALTDV